MKNPLVTITMEDGGVICAELYPDIAPNTVRNFISLVKKGYYDGLTFHRVIEDFMIQGGCPQGTGMGGPGYSIKGEFRQNGFANDLKHERGVVSMARTMVPDSAGSQFFAAFGKVTQGMEVVDQIAQVRVDFNDRPLKPQRMKTVVVDTFEAEFEEPEKV